MIARIVLAMGIAAKVGPRIRARALGISSSQTLEPGTAGRRPDRAGRHRISRGSRPPKAAILAGTSPRDPEGTQRALPRHGQRPRRQREPQRLRPPDDAQPRSPRGAGRPLRRGAVDRLVDASLSCGHVYRAMAPSPLASAGTSCSTQPIRPWPNISAKQGYATAGFVGNIYYCNRRYGLDRGFRSLRRLLRKPDGLPLRDPPELEPGPLPAPPGRSLGPGRLCRGLSPKDGRPAESRPPWLALRRNGTAGRSSHSSTTTTPMLRASSPRGPSQHFGHAERPHKEQIDGIKRYQRLNAHKPKPEDGDPKQVDREGIEILRESYESCIAYIDDQIGRLFADLERPGDAREYPRDRDLRPRRALQRTRIRRARPERLPPRGPCPPADPPPATPRVGGQRGRPRAGVAPRPAGDGRRPARRCERLAVPRVVPRPALERRRDRPQLPLAGPLGSRSQDPCPPDGDIPATLGEIKALSHGARSTSRTRTPRKRSSTSSGSAREIQPRVGQGP